MLRKYPNKCWVFFGTLVAVAITAMGISCSFEKIYAEFILLVAVVAVVLATYAANLTDDDYTELD